MMPIEKTYIEDAKRIYLEFITQSTRRMNSLLKRLHEELIIVAPKVEANSILGKIRDLKYGPDNKHFLNDNGKELSSDEKKILIDEFIFIPPKQLEKFLTNLIKSPAREDVHPLVKTFNNYTSKGIYTIIKKTLGLNVCPYCNRLFINTKGSHNIDHFYNKSKYPIFAVCFYNLIPVCPACNNNKSNDESGYFQNPYSNDFNPNAVSFHPVLKFDDGKIKCSLHIQYASQDSDKESDKDNNGHRKLSSITEGYLENIEYTVDRLKIYDLLLSPYMTNQLKLFNKEFSSSNVNLITMLLGHNILENKINLRPFEKLDRDIHKDIINHK